MMNLRSLHIGRVGRDFFVKRGMNVVLDIIGLHDQPSFADIKGYYEQNSWHVC